MPLSAPGNHKLKEPSRDFPSGVGIDPGDLPTTPLPLSPSFTGIARPIVDTNKEELGAIPELFIVPRRVVVSLPFLKANKIHHRSVDVHCLILI
jgi:hypothetical protein